MVNKSIHGWLNNLPVVDPIQRQQAVPFQLVLIAGLVLELVLIVLEIVVFKVLVIAPQAILPSIIVTLCFGSSLLLLRRGYFRASVGVIVAAIFLAVARGVLLGGLVNSANSLMAFVLPFTLAGLLIGRRILVLNIGLAFVVIVFTGVTEAPVPIEITAQLHAQGILASIVLFISVMGLFAFFLDRFSSALRTAFETTAQRERENERLYKEVNEQRQRLQVTLTSIGDAMIATDSIGQVTMLNPIAEILTGWSQVEAVGKPIADVFRIVNEDTLAPVQSPVDHVLQVGTVVGLGNHTLLIHKNGQKIPIDDSAAPIRDQAGILIGIILVFRDITERRQNERRTANLHKVTLALSNAITIIDVSKIFIGQGVDAVGAIAGTVALLLDDKTLNIIEAEGFSDEALQPWRMFALDSPVPVAEVVRTGSPIWIESREALMIRYPTIQPYPLHQAWGVLPLMIKGHVLGAIAFNFGEARPFAEEDRAHILALAEQCAQALDRAQIYAREQHARQEAERANKLKTEFMAMISHELRTPLASIKGFSTTLLATDVTWDTENEREFIQIINMESDKLTDLIEQLLDLSRLQAGMMRINRQPATWDDILTIARPQLEVLTVHHRLKLHDHENFPILLVDAQRIAQVLVNIINNAVKYSPADTTIEVATSLYDAILQCDISDQGPGIAEEDRGKVFEAFWQLGDTNNPTKMKGAGLGLAICKALIEAHGSRIWIADHPLPGTTVSFTLPLAP